MNNIENFKIAIAIKDYLVKLAIEDKLPTDMNNLLITDLVDVINNVPDREKNRAIELAGHFLACQPDQVEATIRLIINHYDENDLIDDIEGVDVYTKFENSFTVESFADQIGWKEEF
jgi:hypothetical protein